jgi:hypothetical protein
MADEDVGAIAPPLRADPLNLTSAAMIEMLVLENFQDIARIVRQIMLRYIGDQPLTEDEQEIASYINDCALAREADSD